MYMEFQDNFSTTLLRLTLKYAKSLQHMYELNPENITHTENISKYDRY